MSDTTSLLVFAAVFVVCFAIGLGSQMFFDRRFSGRRNPSSGSFATSFADEDYVYAPRVVGRWDAPQVRHLRGVPWHDAEVPPKRHECWPQTDGWMGLTQIQRCACGAIRSNEFQRWSNRNSRQPTVVS